MGSPSSSSKLKLNFCITIYIRREGEHMNTYTVCGVLWFGSWNKRKWVGKQYFLLLYSRSKCGWCPSTSTAEEDTIHRVGSFWTIKFCNTFFNTAAVQIWKGRLWWIQSRNKLVWIQRMLSFTHYQAVHVSNGDNAPRMGIKVAPRLMYLNLWGVTSSLAAIFILILGETKLLWIQKCFGSQNIYREYMYLMGIMHQGWG